MNLNYFRKKLRNLGREPLELDFLGNAPHFQTLWIKAAASKLGLDVKAKSGLDTVTKLRKKRLVPFLILPLSTAGLASHCEGPSADETASARPWPPSTHA